ncbi:MAG: YbhB/YbcL family Raf kinase inhibitor-like protein [Firmicutes bacterium]|nr:YbhB/YbcL family Raf kinase inhibitor-like protein [Bacillota bacterium]
MDFNNSLNRRFKYSLIFCMILGLTVLCSCQGKKPEPAQEKPLLASDSRPLIENTTPKPKPSPKRWTSKSANTPLFPSPAPSVSTTYGSTPEGGNNMEIRLASPAFKEGETIPKKHSGQGADVSPSIVWDKIPPGTKSFALICDDPDAPSGNWVHWVIFNIDPSTTTIAENVPKNLQVLNNALQGKNDFGQIGYNGPMPPPGKAHRYIFTVYALDTMLNLTSACSKAQLEEAMKGHIITQGKLTGLYKR